MRSQLVYEASVKYRIKDAIHKHLYDPVYKRLNNAINELIVKNTLLKKYSHKSFIYKGEFYSYDSAPPPRKMNQLDWSLRDAMDEYLQERKKLNEQEIPFVLGYITQVLNATNCFENYLQLFPDCLHAIIQEFIEICPYHNSHLSQETIEAIKQKNETSIQLLKQRMAINLLL